MVGLGSPETQPLPFVIPRSFVSPRASPWSNPVTVPFVAKRGVFYPVVKCHFDPESHVNSFSRHPVFSAPCLLKNFFPMGTLRRVAMGVVEVDYTLVTLISWPLGGCPVDPPVALIATTKPTSISRHGPTCSFTQNGPTHSPSHMDFLSGGTYWHFITKQ